MANIRRLELEGVYNIRELGGYYINADTVTKWGVFLRSANLATVTANDRDMLYNYGVRTVVDLTSIGESASLIGADKRFNLMQIPLVDFNKFSGSFYLAIIEIFPQYVKEVFNVFAEHINNGVILFHCQSGKDRTGIIAMLLLLIAGASELDVLADYIISPTYLRPVARKRKEPFESIGIWPDELELIMGVLKADYGGAENYLKEIGVSNENIEKIKMNFTQPVLKIER